MDRPADIDEIERTITGGFRLLRFSPDLERRFEADMSEARCKNMQRQNLIGLTTYHAFLVGDYHTVGDAFQLDLFVHFAVCTPVVLILHWIFNRRPPAWLREGLETGSVIVLAGTIVAVVATSASPNRDIVHLTLALVILFAILMQRIRFWYVVAICLVVQVMYSIGLTTMTPFSMERTIMSNSFFVGIVLFSLVGAYHLEHEHRMGYLLRLRDGYRNRQLEIVSLRDPLTGVGNRRALDAAWVRLVDAQERVSPRPTAILLMDIDHFKQFNDTNGHQEGDGCLQRVASLIAESLRDGEGEVYRFGGEEFLVLLDNVPLDGAARVAERVRSAIEQARLPRDPFARSVVTVSAGVASGHLGHDVSPDTLVAAADGALYEAKRNGRNRVHAACERHTRPVPRLGESRLAS